jgi:hypothetical protein
VNDFRCGWTPFSLVWDAAAVLDPRGGTMRDEMVSKPLGWPGGLAGLFGLMDLSNVLEAQLSAMFEYASFEDYWSTFLSGQGKTGSYVTSRDPVKQVYSITSSARRKTDCGIVIPSALAVFILTTNSNLVGCPTGISPGFSPWATLLT